MARINGKDIPAKGKTISEIIALLGYDKTRIAVEINGEILPRAQYDAAVIDENDSVEIVSFVGGG